MLCIYRSKANFAENMANNVKKRVKVPASTPKRKQRMVCLMSEEEVRIVDCYLKKYKITNKARWLRETVLTFILNTCARQHTPYTYNNIWTSVFY